MAYRHSLHRLHLPHACHLLHGLHLTHGRHSLERLHLLPGLHGTPDFVVAAPQRNYEWSCTRVSLFSFFFLCFENFLSKSCAVVRVIANFGHCHDLCLRQTNVFVAVDTSADIGIVAVDSMCKCNFKNLQKTCHKLIVKN